MNKSAFDPYRIRDDFPILSRRINDTPVVYLDSAATSQKPQRVIDALAAFYRTSNANVHRAIHALGEEATEAYEGARITLADFIGAPDPTCCIFVRNTTEGLNLVANAWGRTFLEPGDEIVLTEMEHHSNIVPWQLLARDIGVVIRYVPITGEGILDLETYAALLGDRTKVVGVAHASNVLGTINPVAEIARMAHEAGAIVVVDGAQSVPHMPVDVTALGADFLAFSSHKMCGPTGAGILWGKKELLEEMPPFMGGGDMIERVSKEGTTFAKLPYKFEAGTPDIAEVVAMGVAAGYLSEIGLDAIHAYETDLVGYALEQIGALEGVRIHGPLTGRASLVSFSFDRIHPHDLSEFLNQDSIAVRAGHHCTHILHDVLGVSATTRASFAFYNVREEIDKLIASCLKALDFFG
jgi:cysteine desulfurase/selenocysteine lyase